jgi:hypothetical protein
MSIGYSYSIDALASLSAEGEVTMMLASVESGPPY